jgi:hypothetical protein
MRDQAILISTMTRAKGGQRKSALGYKRVQLDIGTMTDVVNKKLNEFIELGCVFEDALRDELIDRLNVTKARRTFAARILYGLSRMKPIERDRSCSEIEHFAKVNGPLVRQPKREEDDDGRGRYYYLALRSMTPLELLAAFDIHNRLSTGRQASDKIKNDIYQETLNKLPTDLTFGQALDRQLARK